MRFFFYGTLLDGSDNPVAAHAHARLGAAGPAIVRGLIYAIPDPRGWYPGLLAGNGRVHGMLYEAAPSFSAADLARLDAYESYDPRQPDNSLYIREQVTVTAADGSSCKAQAYRFNHPLPAAARPIESGDFRAWLARHGMKPFGGLRES